jgi:hypothetical protein
MVLDAKLVLTQELIDETMARRGLKPTPEVEGSIDEDNDD